MALSKGDVADIAGSSPSPRARAFRYFPNLGLMIGTVNAKGLSALEKSAKTVSSVTPVSDADLIRPQLSLALATAPPAGVSWGIRRIKADALWDRGLTGEGVLIGHVDTGDDASHPALADAIDAFAEFDRIGEQGAGATARDSQRHGTHTAGIMAGRAHDGVSFGVAPDAKIASALVIEGGKTAARLLERLDRCVGQGVRIVNISLGFREFNAQFSDIIRILRQRDILPVVAVGNEGPLTSRSPGNYRESLSVGDVDEFDQIWIDSSSQRFPSLQGYMKPDILGPGVDIWSSIPGGGLLGLSGTSMATPHISGLAALLRQHKPAASVAEIDPQLSKAIRTSRASGSTILAAFTLRDDNNGKGLSPEITDRIVRNAVAKAARATAAQLGGVVLFKNLQSFKGSSKSRGATRERRFHPDGNTRQLETLQLLRLMGQATRRAGSV